MHIKHCYHRLLLLAGASLFCMTGIAQTQQQLVIPPVTVKEIMTGVIAPITNALWAVALDENIPKTDADWQQLENQSIQLLMASAALSLGGSGAMDSQWAKDTKWKGHLLEMIKISNQFLRASRSKNYEGLLDAGDVLIEPCNSCHTDFFAESTQ